MKTIIILGFIVSCALSQSKWEWQSPYPQSNSLQKIFVMDSTIFAFGDHSTIIKSSNNGITWKVDVAVGNDGRNLTDAKFISQNIGFAVGQSGKLIKTTDAGEHWTLIESPTSLNLASIFFISANLGWIGGAPGELYKTTDAGMSWAKESTGGSHSINKIYFADSLLGYFIGTLNNSPIMLKTTDGGDGWAKVNLPVSSVFRGIIFNSREFGWIVGDRGTILRTTTGGDTWEIQKRDSASGASFYDTYFISPDTGWVVGWSNKTVIMTTFNGGRTWKSSQTSFNTLFSVHSDTKTVWATGSAGQSFFSSDAGTSWISKQKSISHTYLKDVFFYGDSVGWTFDNDGQLFKTTSSGKEWAKISNGVNGDRVFFVNSTAGWLVSGSNILKTTDGGFNWATKLTSIEHLYDLYFISDSIGWAVGRYGGILKTTDAGETWIAKNSGESYFLSGVFFVNKNVGWATSFSGGVIKTLDGGDTWFQQYYNSYYNLRCLFFVDSLNGWAAGEFNALLHTTDSGTTWQFLPYESSYGINDIKFKNGIGYAVGVAPFENTSMVIRSTDKGITWIRQDVNVAQDFYGVHFASKDEGWIVGDYGTILHTINGSLTSAPYIAVNNPPTAEILFQNYPNPFNPKTTIKFILPSPSQSKLTVYDILGRQKVVLVDQYLNQGAHELKWDATNVASGIYFYTLCTPEMTITKKLNVVK